MAQHGSQSASPCGYNDFSSNDTMNFTFAELDAILAMIEMHDWCMLSEHLDVDVSLLYDKVSELRDEVA